MQRLHTCHKNEGVDETRSKYFMWQVFNRDEWKRHIQCYIQREIKSNPKVKYNRMLEIGNKAEMDGNSILPFFVSLLEIN